MQHPYTQACPNCYTDYADGYHRDVCDSCGERLPWFEYVPMEVWEDLEYEIMRAQLDYADNYRAYRYSDGWYKEAFKAAARRGCCGDFQSHTIINGEKWIIACNHGH